MQSIFKKRSHAESNFELQITALVDTLVIILIFLLKSIATDTIEIEQSKGIIMPSVFNGLTDTKGSKMAVSATAVSWNGQEYLQLKDFDIKSPLNGKNGWNALNTAIEATVKQEKAENTFNGKLLLQADKATPYPVLQEVLKTAKSYGYKDIKFVAAKYN